ncbi:MAG: hypothetical protein WD669_10885 [Pirellulales bacterium]
MHTIRLRGPWQLEPVARFVPRPDGTYLPVKDDLPAAARATMPADWSASFGADFLGRVRYHRVFQKPTGLEAGERVWLVVEPPTSRGTVSLGGMELGEVAHDGPPGRFEITKQLEDHNRLEVIVEHPTPGGACDCSRPGGLVGEVRLEIEES